MERFKSFLGVALGLLVVVPFAQAQGTLVNDYFPAPSFGGASKLVQVYLPEGYNDPGNSNQYPLMIFLHGAGGTPWWYSPVLAFQLDTLIANGWIEPMILALPDASTPYFPFPPYTGASWYANSALYGPYEDFIVEDVIDHLDATYRTIGTVDMRCLLGHSMGGYGSMKLGAKYPQLFKGVASHAGPLGPWDEVYNPWPGVQAGWAYYGFVPPLNYNQLGPPYPYNFGSASWFMYQIAGALSPNLSNPPYFVDMPIDGWGNFIPAVFDLWLQHDPAVLAEGLEPGELAIYFEHGTNDQTAGYIWATAFAERLDELGLDYTFQTHNGGHIAPDRWPATFIWLDALMQGYANNSCGKGFWKQQVKANMPGGTGSAYYTAADLLGFTQYIFDHFYEMGIEAEGVTYVGATPAPLGLNDLAYMLNINEKGSTMYERACQQYLTLLLNVASEKLVQTAMISQDNATAGQAISYIYTILGSQAELAKNIAETLNLQGVIASGVIPLTTQIIIFGEEAEAAAVAVQPQSFSLADPYPNPFNPTTILRYELLDASHVGLKIFDTAGRLVATLVNGWRDAGEHQMTFDGSGLPSGIYFAKLTAGDFSQVQKLVLMK